MIRGLNYKLLQILPSSIEDLVRQESGMSPHISKTKFSNKRDMWFKCILRSFKRFFTNIFNAYIKSHHIDMSAT